MHVLQTGNRTKTTLYTTLVDPDNTCWTRGTARCTSYRLETERKQHCTPRSSTQTILAGLEVRHDARLTDWKQNENNTVHHARRPRQYLLDSRYRTMHVLQTGNRTKTTLYTRLVDPDNTCWTRGTARCTSYRLETERKQHCTLRSSTQTILAGLEVPHDARLTNWKQNENNTVHHARRPRQYLLDSRYRTMHVLQTGNRTKTTLYTRLVDPDNTCWTRGTARCTSYRLETERKQHCTLGSSTQTILAGLEVRHDVRLTDWKQNENNTVHHARRPRQYLLDSRYRTMHVLQTGNRTKTTLYTTLVDPDNTGWTRGTARCTSYRLETERKQHCTPRSSTQTILAGLEVPHDVRLTDWKQNENNTIH